MVATATAMVATNHFAETVEFELYTMCISMLPFVQHVLILTPSKTSIQALVRQLQAT